MANLEKIIIKQIPFVCKKTSENILKELSSNKNDYIPEGISLINAPFMWDKNITGKNVKIAVIDTGCDINHKDLERNIIGGKNFTIDDNGDVNKYFDYNGHGTHVCGTIAGINNNTGLVGVAPSAQLVVLKALNKSGQGTLKGIIDAINYAIELKVDIISMSLGTQNNVEELHKAIRNAVDKNILVVCAAGNEGDKNGLTDEYSYPAAYNEVISVGAVDFKRSASQFTNSNKEVDLVAPGVDIVSTYMDNKYAMLSGTSMATPHITGALALLIEWSTKEFGRRLTEAELYAQLIKNTNILQMSRTLQGNGILNLHPEIIS